MFSKDHYQNCLLQRLKSKGLFKSTIPGYIMSLKNCIRANPDWDHMKINRQLQLLGWDDFELDYHTMQLAVACFEVKKTK